VKAEEILLSIVHAHRGAQVLYATVELGILDTFVNCGGSVQKAASITGTDVAVLRRFYRALVVYGLLRQKDKDFFSLTPLGEALTCPNSLAKLEIISAGRDYIPAFEQLASSIRSGVPAFDIAFGLEFFDSLKLDPEAANRHDKIMEMISDKTSTEIVEHFPFFLYNTIVDVGGGRGGLIEKILTKNEGCLGILFDMPHVITHARQHPQLGLLLNRLKLIEGDFFESVPAGGDLYILKWILHDWSDNEAYKILCNCRKNIRNNGRLLVVDWIMPEVVDSSTTAVHADLTMLVFHHGRERTYDEQSMLLGNAGFEIEQTQYLPSGRALLLAR